MALESVYDSLEYEGRKPLKKYNKQLTKINALSDKYRAMSDEELKNAAKPYQENFNIHNKNHVNHVYAIAREVTYRLLGKFQYDVQVLGALACIDRNIIQMSTGSGKTITIILPAVAFGLTHKGVNILTVNDYLSERDWKETKPVYDWFGLTNAYTSNDHDEPIQREAFACDITYSTNSTLGFAYLNSALASDIGQDIKIITRPLHAAIIDEADEILMDDARNPLIIANAKDLGKELDYVTYKGRDISVYDIVTKLKTLTNIGYDKDSHGSIFIDDKTLDEIITKLDLDNDIFDDPKLMHIIYSSVNAIYQYKPYTDYIVAAEPDPDSGSRIILIDKATGRLSHGRTLSDNLHAFIEMKEDVFTGQSNESTIQITYQTLFNLFATIAGVSGTLGTSFAEFKEIYETGVLIIPDRLPNQLQQTTHLYMSHHHLHDDLIRKTKIYMSSYRPVLIGAQSDIEAEMLSKLLSNYGIEHRTLISTDDNEDVIVAEAGKPGSVVVTTDIMGRGTDIHVENVEDERGLVVLQVGSRPNSRVERQFAGRAGRQGQPGKYHRMLTFPELKSIGLPEQVISELLTTYRNNREIVEAYHGDLMLNGHSVEYDRIKTEIDNALRGSESAYSTSRIEDFNTYSITDLIQTSLLTQLDEYRLAIKKALDGDDEELRQVATKLALPEQLRKNKKMWKLQKKQIDKIPKERLIQMVFKFTVNICEKLIPELREYSDNAIGTVKMSMQVKYDVKPEILMLKMIQTFLKEHAKEFVLDLEEFDD